MEIIALSHPNKKINASLTITGSKSESNRLLILNALFGNNLSIENLSNAEDTDLMTAALKSTEQTIDIHHAGTAMRFLTAYFSIQNGRETILTGSSRMKERPIGILVEALQNLGAEISYLENDGFPPIKIVGKKITENKVSISAGTSSQYLSALLLVGSQLENGLELELVGKVTSLPYLKMTTSVLEDLGIEVQWKGDNFIQVFPCQKLSKDHFTIESDWSSASYHYSYVALGEKESQINLSHYKKESLQGDSILTKIYAENFGVETEFSDTTLKLTQKEGFSLPSSIELDLSTCPDIAQTIAVTAAGLQIPCKLTGLHTLKIKETDRLVALQNELSKCGAEVQIDEKSLEILSFTDFDKTPQIATYRDHRMAMAFAPLSLLYPIKIEEPKVVEKSYPDFWNDLKKMDFQIQ